MGTEWNTLRRRAWRSYFGYVLWQGLSLMEEVRVTPSGALGQDADIGTGIMTVDGTSVKRVDTPSVGSSESGPARAEAIFVARSTGRNRST